MQISVDDYISYYPEKTRERLQKIRAIIRQCAPEATETISYGMPAYGVLVYFAAYGNHIGFYPTPAGVNAFREELVDYHTSKGAIQFPHEKPLPYKLLEEIVRFRVAENKNKSEKNKSS